MEITKHSFTYLYTSLHLINLFSIMLIDDLFEDDDETPVQKEAKKAPKKKYLEEDWTLDPEDKKEFKGFPKGDIVSTEPKGDDEDSEPKNYPAFALLYKFRSEYFDSDVASMMADHKGYCKKFKRLINSEELRLNKSKGVVLLWAGFTEDDKEETRQEVLTFVEDDPLIVKDAIQMWDIIDLQDTGGQEVPELKPKNEGEGRGERPTKPAAPAQ